MRQAVAQPSGRRFSVAPFLSWGIPPGWVSGTSGPQSELHSNAESALSNRKPGGFCCVFKCMVSLIACSNLPKFKDQKEYLDMRNV
jgi:hypothetical protein